MRNPMKQVKTIDGYIKDYPFDVQKTLQKLREQIKECAPDSKEAISYGIPTFRLNGNLVHFAAYKKHIGFYPTPSGVNAFKDELSDYKTSKGAIQFPIDKPIPFDLVKKIIRFRVKENLGKK